MNLRVWLMIAGMCVGCGVVLAQQENRVPNSGFEQADGDLPAGWRPSIIKGDGVSLQYVQSPRGGRCVSITSTQPDVRAGWAVAERISVISGDRLTITMQVKLEELRPGPGGGEGFLITCHFYDNAAYLTWATSAGTMQSGDWHEERLECPVPAGATGAILGFRLSGCTGRALVDDVVMLARKPERQPGEEEYGLRPDDPAAKLTVGLLPGDMLGSLKTHQLIDLLNRQGIAAVVFDPVNAGDFSAEAEGLRRFAAVLIGGLNPQSGAGVLEEAQLTAVRDYVSAGGGLIACAPAVAGTPLAECLPAEVGEPVRDWHFIPETVDATHPALADIVFPWPGFGLRQNETTCYRATAREGASVPAVVPEQVAGPGVPFLACRSFGQGRVALINSTWTGNLASDFLTWRYAPRLLSQLTRWVAGMPQLAAADKPPLPDPHEPVAYGGRWHGAAPDDRPAPPDPATLPQVTLDLGALRQPTSAEQPVTAPPTIEDQPDRVIVSFANGARVVMHKSAQVELFAPDGTRLTAEPSAG
ncbi:MAG TPA: hypothetical protein VM283_06245, partial [Armatimonadota bacterium]|nr:hypothetical protein [Armatimonadota bacterium]